MPIIMLYYNGEEHQYLLWRQGAGCLWVRMIFALTMKCLYLTELQSSFAVVLIIFAAKSSWFCNILIPFLYIFFFHLPSPLIFPCFLTFSFWLTNKLRIICKECNFQIFAKHLTFFFSEKYLEVEIFIIIFETNLVDIGEAKTEEMSIASILLTSPPFPLIAFMNRFDLFSLIWYQPI